MANRITRRATVARPIVTTTTTHLPQRRRPPPPTIAPATFFVTSADHEFGYEFHGRHGTPCRLVIRQTSHEETWPGGALWDLGVLLSHVLLAMAGISTATTVTTTTIDDRHNSNNNSNNIDKKRHQQHVIPSWDSLTQNHPNPPPVDSVNNTDDWLHSILLSPRSTWLELGCGVGLTGLVAAAALRPALVVLTDLSVVIDQVTRLNVEENTTKAAIKKGGKQKHNQQQQQQQQQRHGNKRMLGPTNVVAHPLCWGNEEDQVAVQGLIQEFHQLQQKQQQGSIRKGKPKGANATKAATTNTTNTIGKPDVILIGDVAYQHKPGAPSHFEALHQTLRQLSHDDTILIFGTRIRMPASHDLLALFRQDMEPLLQLPADSVEPRWLGNVKHNMTIHFLRRKTESDRSSEEG
mmetsp:Transcript_3651/g.10051  ORF Transcript_3651/g.10051 Transcript_3651/m.10051 type:complete len:407 (+) Transcript_3651:84-1304(+)